MEESNMSNATNNTDPGMSHCPYDYCVEDTIYRKVMGTLIFIAVWPFIVQDMKFFPLGRPAAALLGATLMVVFTITPQGQVFRILGDRGNLQAICLLVGMMMLSFYYDREGLLHLVALRIFSKGKQFRHILWKVCVLSAVLSAVITNDATCVVLTPLLLSEHIKQKRSPREIAPLLLGIATSANIGSASTFFGNPQNAFIASQANLSLLIFFITSLPAAVIGIAINTGLLYLVYYKVIFRQDNCSGSSDCAVAPTEQSNVPAVSNGLITPSTVSMSMEDDREQQLFQYHNQNGNTVRTSVDVERIRLCHNGQSTHTGMFAASIDSTSTSSLPTGNSRGGGLRYHERETSLSTSNITDIRYGAASMGNLHAKNGKGPLHYACNDRSLQASKAAKGEQVLTKSIRERPLRAKIFILWLGLATILLVALLAVPPLDHLTFNLGLLPVGVAVLTMLVDTIVNRRYSHDVMTSVDWTIILLFFGLFVWLAGFENTMLPRQAFKKMHRFMNLSTVWGVLLFTLFVIVGSNILSNVPLVILVIDELDTFECGLADCSQLTGVLLAWVSTIAGNFTLIGSVANLIVAEKARSSADYNLTFWEYLKFGIPSTVLVLFTGLPVVYFTGKYVSINI